MEEWTTENWIHKCRNSSEVWDEPPLEALQIKWWNVWDKLRTREEIVLWLNSNLEELKKFRVEMWEYLQKAAKRALNDAWEYKRNLFIEDLIFRRVGTITIWGEEFQRLILSPD
jgi:hypothetical protein